MARLWKDLPPEILEFVLAWLPVHVLCRFRLVCKQWNHLITQPAFISLRANKPRRASYILVAPKVLHRMKKNWEILDMAEKRFYTLGDTFIIDFISRRYGALDRCGWSKHTAAANGDLIYVMYEGPGREFGTRFCRHFVCNPLSESFHQIPDPKQDFPSTIDHDIVVMAVDSATQSYRIIIMDCPNLHPSGTGEEDIHLYDSTTTEWRKLCKLPVTHHRPHSCIFLNGVFYALYVDTSLVPWCPRLYSCNLETGAWSYIDVDLPKPSCLVNRLQLVVSLGRLFLIEYTGLRRFIHFDLTRWPELADFPFRKNFVIKLKIWEILLAKKQVVKVAEMPKYAKYPEKLVRQSYSVVGNPVVAIGCGDSIVISSSVGRCVGWNLLRNCWEDLPASKGNGLCTPGQGICVGLVAF